MKCNSKMYTGKLIGKELNFNDYNIMLKKNNIKKINVFIS